MTTLSLTPPLENRNFGRVAGVYALTFALAILIRLLVPWIGHAAIPLTMLTPAVAVAIMLCFAARESGWRQALRGLGLTRLSFRSWPVAIAAPSAIMAGGLLIMWATGLTGIVPVNFGPAVVLDLVVSLAVGSLFALGEEIGWRGYILPRLMGLGPMTAMLLAGFLQSLWHLPIMMTTDLYHAGANLWIAVPLFVTTITLAGVFFGALRLKSGSIWPVAIAHGALNVGWNLTFNLTENRNLLTTEYIGGESGLIMIAGLAAVAVVIGGSIDWLRPRG